MAELKELKIQKIWLAMGLGQGTKEYKEAEEKYRTKFDSPIGFNKVSDNPDWEEMGMLCKWEHCIELTIRQEQRGENSCPVFGGHDCPGGPRRVHRCRVDLGYVKEEFGITSGG